MYVGRDLSPVMGDPRREGTEVTAAFQLIARLSIALLILLSTPFGTAQAQVESDEAYANAIHFRQTLGFSTDSAFVRTLGLQPAPGDPIPLAPAESAELARRLEVQENLSPIGEWGRTHASQWGGLWIDHSQDGLLIVQLVGPVSPSTRAELLALAPAAAKVELRSVGLSYAQLVDLVDLIYRDLSDLKAEGIDVTDALIRTDLNRVEILVRGGSDSQSRELQSRYGSEAVLVTQVPASGATGCSTRSACPGPPLRAGISGSFGCSVSFVSYKGSPAAYYLLTAGHCAANGSTWYHGTLPLGTMSANSTYDGSTADAALIGPISAGNISRWVYRTYNSVNIVTTRDNPFDDAIGDLVCLSAKQAEAVRCGKVTGLNGFHEIQPGVVLQKQYYANYAWQGGDSGGAVFYAARAIGIQSGFAGDWATFSHVHYAQARTGGWVNVSNCGDYC